MQSPAIFSTHGGAAGEPCRCESCARAGAATRLECDGVPDSESGNRALVLGGWRRGDRLRASEWRARGRGRAGVRARAIARRGAWSSRANARACGDRVCYFGAGERLEETIAPRWSARYRRPRRAAELGSATLERDHCATRLAARAAQSRAQQGSGGDAVERGARGEESGARARCSHEWLGGLGLPPLHFLIETDTIALTRDRRIFVASARRDGSGVSRGVARSRAPGMADRADRARSRSAERHLGAARRCGDARAGGRRCRVRDSGARAAFATIPLLGSLCAAPGCDSLLRWVRAHGRRFYDFDGLDRFKTKFAPEEWEEIIAIDDRAPFSMRALWAIAAAFGGSSPITLFARTVRRAIVQELRWLARR